eukprot:scaffold52432_cov17-Tisochrysis_lutea.AAC.2
MEEVGCTVYTEAVHRDCTKEVGCTRRPNCMKEVGCAYGSHPKVRPHLHHDGMKAHHYRLQFSFSTCKNHFRGWASHACPFTGQMHGLCSASQQARPASKVHLSSHQQAGTLTTKGGQQGRNEREKETRNGRRKG